MVQLQSFTACRFFLNESLVRQALHRMVSVGIALLSKAFSGYAHFVDYYLL